MIDSSKEIAIFTMTCGYATGKENIEVCIERAFKVFKEISKKDLDRDFKSDIFYFNARLEILNELLLTNRILENKDDFFIVIKKIEEITKEFKYVYSKEMNKNTVDINTSPNDMIIKLSRGNPLAIRTLMELRESYINNIDKLNTDLLSIFEMGLFGKHLYMLWNDCCNRDIEKVKTIIELYRKGRITSKDIDKRVKNVERGISLDDLIGE